MKLLGAFAVLVLQASTAVACIYSGTGSIERLIGAEFVVAGRFAECTERQIRSIEPHGEALELVIEVTDQNHVNVTPLMQGRDLKFLLPGRGYAASWDCGYAVEEGRKFLLGLAVLNLNTGSVWKFHREPKYPSNGVFPNPPILETGDRLVLSQSALCHSGMLFPASDDMIDRAKRVFDGVGDLEMELEELVSSHARYGLY
ncbi:hypothetical protein ABVF61_19865 [Roseibium sp. HPY-6]|uniref:hypothetical protein n=1 Tax=Roseibium sp. HPY-6 TaxID=3229852 RepID=UPI003390529E